MTTWIDTHAHVNDTFFNESLPSVMQRARQNGVQAVIAPSYDEKSLEHTANISTRYAREIFPAFGIHPWYITPTIPYEQVKEYCQKYKAVAVGEIGLDFSPDCPPQDRQREVFQKQVELAVELDLPVILHTRKAHDAMGVILKEYKKRYQEKFRGVLHSFGGGAELALQAVQLGFYISFSGSVTRSNAKKYHKMVQAMPLEYILVETDCPCIATQTSQASLTEPSHVVEIGTSIAQLRKMSVEDIGRITTENARRLFPVLAEN